MKVLIAGCSLAGLATALSLVTKFEEKKKKTREYGHSEEDTDDSGGSSIEIVIVERRGHLDSRGATFGLAKNGQIALQEIAPPHVLQGLQDKGIYVANTSGYMLPWWPVRDALLRCAREESPYKEAISLYLGCVVKEVLEEDVSVPLKISFEASGASTNPTGGGEGELSTIIPPTQEFDLLIGADGMNSQIRTQVLQCPPAIPTDVLVWRGSVDTSPIPALHHFQNNPLFECVPFGENIFLTYFNHHSKMPGTIAWVLTVRNASHQLKLTTSSPLQPEDLIKAYLKSLDDGDPRQDKDDSKFREAQIIFNNTNDPSDLTWSTELAIVDLESPAYCKSNTTRWGGRGRITLVGDAAHSVRPASGLGGALAFEDAAVLGRCLFEYDPPDATTSGTIEGSISSHLAHFEALRMPRCQSISRDQTWRSTLSYEVGPANVPAWDPQYRDWVFEGPDATPHPPVNERAVFGSLLPTPHET